MQNCGHYHRSPCRSACQSFQEKRVNGTNLEMSHRKVAERVMTTTEESPLVLRLFGPMEALVHGTPISSPRTRKAMWLLALLALQGDTEADRRWLAALLWPDSTDELALYNLRRYLTLLRDLLGPEAGRIQTPTPRSLSLDLRGASVDVVTFDQCIAVGDHAALRMAVGLYRGQLLEGCADEWVPADREARQQAYIGAVIQLATAAKVEKRYKEAEVFLRRAIKEDPFRDSLYGALMEALAATGDYSQAVLVYRDLRTLLRNELNAEPSPECAEMFKRIRAGARQSTVAFVPALRPRQPDRTVSPGLPQPPTRLIGRDDDLQKVKARLSQSRLVTMTGSGGVGKTRLALQVAREIEEEFTDGAYFVDLAPVQEGGNVEAAIARTLGVREEPPRAIRETLLESLRPRDALLVLDNCEHLIESAALCAASLLASCASVRILATSRRPLTISGESLWRVPSLALPDEARLTTPSTLPLTAISSSGAVRLFVERAAESVPGFALTQDNAPIVARICRRLDGIPLALELAAARLRAMTLEQVDERLERQFSAITSGPAGRVPRHQSMSAAIEWSYDLLDEAERALLRRLSIFAGGFSLEAAEQICRSEHEEGQVLETLFRLLDHSLVMFEEDRGAGRYDLLEPVRKYAWDRLISNGEEMAVALRHRQFFLDLAESAAERMIGHGEAEWVQLLDQEHDNLRAALRSSSEPLEKLRLTAAIWRFWLHKGQYEEGRGWLEQALAYDHPISQALAASTRGYAVMRWKQGDQRAALLYMSKAQAMYDQLGDRRGVASALNDSALILSEVGDDEAARTNLEESLAICRGIGNTVGEAFVVGNLGTLALRSADLDRAKRLLEESEQLLRAAGCEQTIGGTLRDLAQIAVSRKEYDRARGLLERSIEIHLRFGHRENVALSACRLGAVTVALGDLGAARLHLQTGLTEWRGLGSRRGLATALTGFAHLAAAEGDMARAAHLFGASEALREALNFPLAPVWREEHERRIEAVRSALTEQEFARAWQDGRRMTADEAIGQTYPGS
jgi:predicted ATPase/DNA-binding SARP family transcriptional activator